MSIVKIDPSKLPDENTKLKSQIAKLEASITPRRLREAITSGDYTFIIDIESEIQNLRSKLTS